MSNFSNQIFKKFESLDKAQLYEAESRLEDDLVNGEFMWLYKKEELIKSWAQLKHYEHDIGVYKKPLSTISTHIRQRLKARGCDEYAQDYVSRVLTGDYAIYKDDTYSHRHENSSQKPSIIETWEDMAGTIRTRADLEELSPAEYQEVANVIFNKDKEIRQRLRDCKDDVIAVAHERKIRLKQLDKTSAEDPPEEFWGQSQLYFTAEKNEKQHKVLMDYWRDIKQIVYRYKPEETIDKKASDFLNRYSMRVMNPLAQLNLFAYRGLKDILGMVSDAKNCQPLMDWFDTVYDKEATKGAHGAGVLHAIETGDYIMELGKDDRSVVILPIEREFTREQCTDKVEKMLQEARNNLMKDDVERFIQLWSKQTEFQVDLNDPDEFYKQEMARKGRKIPN